MKKISITQKISTYGGVATAGVNIASYLVLLIPTLITSVVDAALAIKQSVSEGSNNSRVTFKSPRASIRIAAVPSRSAVTYTLPDN
jgi:hypothetical protein